MKPIFKFINQIHKHWGVNKKSISIWAIFLNSLVAGIFYYQNGEINY